MRFARPPRRQLAESVVSMINVVFLLLIFFMMSARIAPPPPFDISLPVSESEATLEEDLTLYISAEGTVGFRGAMAAEAWSALLQSVNMEQRLSIHADANLPTPRLARILAQLADIGIKSVELAVGTP